MRRSRLTRLPKLENGPTLLDRAKRLAAAVAAPGTDAAQIEDQAHEILAHVHATRETISFLLPAPPLCRVIDQIEAAKSRPNVFRQKAARPRDPRNAVAAAAFAAFEAASLIEGNDRPLRLDRSGVAGFSARLLALEPLALELAAIESRDPSVLTLEDRYTPEERERLEAIGAHVGKSRAEPARVIADDAAWVWCTTLGRPLAASKSFMAFAQGYAALCGITIEIGRNTISKAVTATEHRRAVLGIEEAPPPRGQHVKRFAKTRQGELGRVKFIRTAS